MVRYSPILVAALVVMLATTARSQSNLKSEEIDRCLALADPVVRLHCLERIVQKPTQMAASDSGSWRLAQIRNPRGGRDGVSLTHVADTLHSDLDVAGLMLRCVETEIEVLVVLIEPRSPRSRHQTRRPPHRRR